MKALLINLYDLGHQPFGLASPAAWLREAGAEVALLDLAVQALDESLVQGAEFAGIFLPMHTATKLAIPLIPKLKTINPDLHICCFGLYAPLNEEYLRGLGVDSIIGGEFESELVRMYKENGPRTRLDKRGASDSTVSVERLNFKVPAREGMPAFSQYAHLQIGESKKLVGYTEASRGCKHKCRHCPVVPVYQGTFRVVQADVVLADVTQMVAAGAQHITFGDPDFFNGPTHAMRVVRQLHEQFPDITYDVIIKIEHLIKHKDLLPELVRTGCLFVTSAVEAMNDEILQIFDKGHTVADVRLANELCKNAGLLLIPTFVAFTPWTTKSVFQHFLRQIVALDWVEKVASVQLGIRLLMPASSPLLSHPQMKPHIGEFDPESLSYSWHHPDPAMDLLQEAIMAEIRNGTKADLSRRESFNRVWQLAFADEAKIAADLAPAHHPLSAKPIPFMSHAWY